MSAVVSMLGSRPVSGLFELATRGRLRVVAYHTVADPEAFAAQLRWFGSRGYTSVTSGQVCSWATAAESLPPRPLWLTFDDGDRSVVEEGLPLLRRHGMVATAFLCGAFIDSTDLPWWVTLAAAQRAGLVRPEDVGQTDPVAVRLALKGARDGDRRRVIAALAERIAAAGIEVRAAQWAAGDVADWTAAGNDVGNHSWDHPCLDHCDPDEQRRQVRLAHERLSGLTGRRIDVFSWPNGNPAEAATDELRALGYRLVLTAGHRLVARRPEPFGIERLRLDSDVPVTRARAIVSGAHPAVFHLQKRLRRNQPSDDVT